MIIWQENKIVPKSLKSIIFKRIEENHIDKKKFYTSYAEGFGSTTFSDILVPYYGDIIDGIMKDLGMFKRSRYYYIYGYRCTILKLILIALTLILVVQK